MNILYCISDHGYGHATRSIPTINLLLERDHTIIIRNKNAIQLLKKELVIQPTKKTKNTSTNKAKKIFFIKQQNDIGVLQKKNSYIVDKKATKNAVTQWMNNWLQDIKKLRAIIKKHHVELVISDSSPQPHLAATQENIPSLFLGSFTWLDIYKPIHTLNKKQEKIMRRTYNNAHAGIILPFNQLCDGVKNQHCVSLIGRAAKKTLRPIQNSILYTLGGGSLAGTKQWNTKNFTGTMIISSWVKNSPTKRYLKIDEHIPSVEYTNAATLVLGKSGYSISAEAMRCKKPMFYIKRKGFNDDDVVTKEITRLGIGVVIKEKDLAKIVTDNLFKRAQKLQKHYKHLPSLYRRDGAKEALKIIEQYAPIKK